MLKQKLAALAAIAIGSLATALPASAALPTEATALFTSLETDATAGVALGWPLMAIVTGGFILYRIVRRAANTGAK